MSTPLSPVLDPTVKRARVLRITIGTMLTNIVLATGKLLAGLTFGSTALLSDAANSATDVVSEIILMIGVRLAGREPDDDHPYGHERFESIVTLILAFIIVATGLSIGWEGVNKLISGSHGDLVAPDAPALWVAAGVMVFKEGMYWFTRARARQLSSDVLLAAAADHRSDVLGTLGGFIGIAAARLGLPIADPLASLVIAVLIIRTAIEIFRRTAGQMTDRSAGEEIDARIRRLAGEQPGVARVDLIRTRMFADRVYADVEIAVDGTLTLDEAHDIAESVHDYIETELPEVKHIMVHVNPA